MASRAESTSPENNPARQRLVVNPHAVVVADLFKTEAGRSVAVGDVAHLLDIDKTLRDAKARCCTCGCIGEQVFVWFFVAICLQATLFVMAKIFNFQLRE